MRMWVESLAPLSGLRTLCCRELCCRSETRLGSGVAVAVVQAGSCGSDSAPSLGTSTCRTQPPPKKRKADGEHTYFCQDWSAGLQKAATSSRRGWRGRRSWWPLKKPSHRTGRKGPGRWTVSLPKQHSTAQHSAPRPHHEHALPVNPQLPATWTTSLKLIPERKLLRRKRRLNKTHFQT